MMRTKLSAFFEAIFPPRCASCGCGGAIICTLCQTTTQWIKPPLCPKCGSSIPQDHPYRTCYNCYKQPLTVTAIRAAAWLTPPVQPLIHQFKYNRQTGLVPHLATLLIERWPLWRNVMDVDVVVPIPLHPEREQDRGFNQSYLLAVPFAEAVNIPLETEAIFRVRATKKQVELKKGEDRRKNVDGAFQANGKLVKGQRVLLIDDVVTTGSTLNAAATALHAAGAQSVSAYCVARPKRKRQSKYEV